MEQDGDVVQELPVVGVPGGTERVRISLTPQEVAIFSVLLETVRAQALGTVVRVAGGWVRDKLMGRPSHDIDITVDNMTGVAFANAVNAQLASTGEATGSIGVIAANPEQSKHLETATCRVRGAWLDFVHLRAEAYDEGSRIPRVVIGTPAQDAERRDFTLNALFYNVSECSVEDWTGRGLADLRAHILVTPLPAEHTLRDDPLRVLRAVRFASRFAFTLCPSLRAAASSPAVHADLAAKVSRERVGMELDGMTGGIGRPLAALRTLAACGLTPVVFAPPAGCTFRGPLSLPGFEEGRPGGEGAYPPDLHAAASSAGVAGALPPSWTAAGCVLIEAVGFAAALAVAEPACAGFLTAPSPVLGLEPALLTAVPPWPPLGFHTTGGVGAAWLACPPESSAGDEALERVGPSFAGVESMPGETRRLLLLAATLYPLRSVVRVGARGKEEGLVPLILIEGLKRRTKDGADVGAIVAGAAGLSRVCAAGGEPDRLATGLVLRGVAREHWRSSLLLGAASSLVPVLLDPARREPVREAATGVSASSAAAIASALGPWQMLSSAIVTWGLERCYEWKPALSGGEVTAALGLRPGPALGVLIDELMRWQMLGGAEGDKAAALAHLSGVVQAAGGPDAFTKRAADSFKAATAASRAAQGHH